MRLFLALLLSLVANAALAQNPTCPTRPVGDNSNACASTAFVQSALPSVIVTEAPFSALCNGTGDDSAAINAAINSFPLPGAGVVLFPPNANCRVTSTINIGNGTVSTASTRQGVILRGIGNPNTAPIFPGFTATAGPKITWAGSGASGVISINGPLQGWAVENLYIDCSSIAASVGLLVTSAQNGETTNLSLINCTKGYGSTAVAPFGSFTNTNAQHNKHTNTSIQVAAVANSIGILLTGVTTANTDFDTWVGTDIFLPTSAVAVSGVVLQATDTDVFADLHIFGGNASAISIGFDYSISSSWPSSVAFFGVDPFQSGGGGQWSNGGTTPGGAKANYIVALGESNSATCPNIANLACFQSSRMFFNPGGNNIGKEFPPPAWTTFTPTPVCGTATFTVTAAKFYNIGKSTNITMDFQITALGTCAAAMTFTLPNTPNTPGGLSGNNSNSGDTPSCRFASGSTTATCNNGVGTNFANNDRLFLTGTYENQ